jgi:hypothetical protein
MTNPIPSLLELQTELTVRSLRIGWATWQVLLQPAMQVMRAVTPAPASRGRGGACVPFRLV